MQATDTYCNSNAGSYRKFSQKCKIGVESLNGL